MTSATRSNRADRIATAKAVLDAIESQWREINNNYQDAKISLQRAQDSFDIGEKVYVTQHCSRGCCDKDSYTGTVVSVTSNGLYAIRADDGTMRDSWDATMRRSRTDAR